MNPRSPARGSARPTRHRRQPLRAALVRLTLVVAALAALCARPATAQEAACPTPEQIQPAHLYGLWQIQLWSAGAPENPPGASPGGAPERALQSTPSSTGVLLFERHPEYPGSVRGELRRSVAGQDLAAQVSGDVTDGVFNLDESEDGQRISAVWEGEPQDCGRAIRGSRRPAEGRPAAEATQQFLLRKLPGWQ